ncbi:hypothetical protein A2154_03085 [Candidatus Gottesmanbacteria bacterium RBG_16_43_7]|uniref:Uncharacterized protein n=1 Tax=Candidatus Gottesmanbacteria bacterium RBG_16_43_7 TaxID=1798373 RepID=A0A1F5ZBW1_9BACT|nr:MAG: hypothetical protein A2154_03085 [Candidatus Gottesmanbacteria bacterium RBG_16_43_7]
MIKLLRFALVEMGGYKTADHHLEIDIHNLARWQINYRPADDIRQLTESDTLDQVLYEYIKWIFKAPAEGSFGLNSGTWVGTLPKEIRLNYIKQYYQTAKKLSQSLLELRHRSVQIIWVQGNEDMSLSLENITYNFDDEQIFDTTDFLTQQGIAPITEIGGQRGQATYFIWIPFSSLKPNKWDIKQLSHLQTQVEQARAAGLEIVMVTHLQPDWSKHFPSQTVQGEAAQMIANLNQAIDLFQPQHLVYPHQHDEILDRPDSSATYSVGETGVFYLPLLASAQKITIPGRPGRTNRIPAPIRRIIK